MLRDVSHITKRTQEIAHEDQLDVWASEIVGILSMNGYLRDEMSYQDGVDLAETIKCELLCIIDDVVSLHLPKEQPK